MKDRQPTRPGRVRITPENGEAYYAVMEMADEPTEVGTPPIKANLLKDTTAALLGGDSSMVPDEALVILKNLFDSIDAESLGAIRVETGSYVGSGSYGASNPKSLTFSFVPKLLFVGRHNSIMDLSIFPVYSLNSEFDTTSTQYGCLFEQTKQPFGYAKLNGTTVTWYGTSETTHLNVNSAPKTTYDYTAFG